MSMRGIYSSVTDIRRKGFTEVTRLAYAGPDYSRLAELPYNIVPGEVAKYRESISGLSEIVGERVILALGMVVLIAVLFAVENWFGKDVEG